MERTTVILLHGLARSSRSMRGMERRLQRAGFQTLNLDYPSRRLDLVALADRYLHPAVTRLRKRGQTLHFVTHSMGGILLRCYLRGRDLPELGRVVMLSPPNHGSEIVDRFRSWRLFSAFFGPAGCSLGTETEDLPGRLGAARFDLGIITGRCSMDPLISHLVPKPNDGRVSVASARLEGMADFLVVSCGHSLIMNHPRVREQVLHYLRCGCFAHTLPSREGGPVS